MLKKDLIPQPAFMEPIRSKSNRKTIKVIVEDGKLNAVVAVLNDVFNRNVPEGSSHEFTFGVDDGRVDIQLETWVDELGEQFLDRRSALFGIYEAKSKVINLKNLEIEAHNVQVDEFYEWLESRKSE